MRDAIRDVILLLFAGVMVWAVLSRGPAPRYQIVGIERSRAMEVVRLDTMTGELRGYLPSHRDDRDGQIILRGVARSESP